MKLQIDTTAKTIKILDSVKFGDLVKALKALFGEEYKDFTLVPDVTVYWSYPWTWTYQPYVSTPVITWETTAGGYIPAQTTTAYTPIDGHIYNIDVQYQDN